LNEEQDIVDHNWFEELQMNGHLKKWQNAGYFDFLEWKDLHPMEYDDGCHFPMIQIYLEDQT
jgi:hypothetical protein